MNLTLKRTFTKETKGMNLVLCQTQEYRQPLSGPDTLPSQLFAVLSYKIAPAGIRAGMKQFITSNVHDA